ncbi:TolC family protein [Hydrogenimonas sp.]
MRRIEETAWRLWSLRQRLELVEGTLRLTEQNIDLFEAYTATHDAQNAHMGLMQAHLTHSRLLAQLERLKGEAKAAAELLGYLSFSKTPVGEVTMPQLDKPLPPGLARSPRLRQADAAAEGAERRLALAKLSLDLDPVLSLGYAHRTEYEDYLSVSVGFSLPVYGTQRSRIEAARHAALAQKSALLNTRLELEARIGALTKRAASQKRILTILRQKSLPEIEHMFDLAASDIAAGGDLYRFIDLLEQKLRLEVLAVEAETAYRQLRARIRALKGIR